ncbi:hypothetical protein HHK36_006542 [Tetracentron sinense]|uniref:Uncharacterized protein n=1 Tax=Tetracentron sinense TaxID=13715 RepID=A0A834ZI76_TETSI|nr:hypothetical protein HHK36_006542 [Tetracentron sinense]
MSQSIRRCARFLRSAKLTSHNGSFSRLIFFHRRAENHHQSAPEKRLSDPKPSDHFMVDNNEAAVITDGSTGSDPPQIVTVVYSSNSSFSASDPHFSNNLRCTSSAQFSGDLCVSLVEKSFSSADLQKLLLISGMKAYTDEAPKTREFQPRYFRPEPSISGMARSKRSLYWVIRHNRRRNLTSRHISARKK